MKLYLHWCAVVSHVIDSQRLPEGDRESGSAWNTRSCSYSTMRVLLVHWLQNVICYSHTIMAGSFLENNRVQIFRLELGVCVLCDVFACFVLCIVMCECDIFVCLHASARWSLWVEMVRSEYMYTTPSLLKCYIYIYIYIYIIFISHKN